ncbi:hypothetical protein IT570_09975 [Candidatus Sumerlaeota bacterium]|nr:hypothetical protein [Candidatus Sumerlaeota bacterium]
MHIITRILILSSILALPVLLAAKEPEATAKTEGAEARTDRKSFTASAGQVYSVTYKRGEETITRYFKLVEGKFKRLHLIEVKDLGGEEIPMPVLKEISPNAIFRDEDDYNYERSADDDPETWVLRCAGFFFAAGTARRDAPTRPQLITAANGLTYRYYGAASYMPEVMAIVGPGGEHAVETTVYAEQDGKPRELLTTKPAKAKPETKNEEAK